MSPMKYLARLAAVVILGAGAFAGISGPANAEAKSGHHHVVVQPRPLLVDTGWD